MIRTITIKEAYIPELIEVFGVGYQENIIDPEQPNDPEAWIPNPQTKAEFAAEQFDVQWRESVIQKVQRYRQQQANLSIETESIIE